MRLRDTLCALRVLAGLLENFVTISIADVPDKAVEIRTGQIKEYMVYRWLVKELSNKSDKEWKTNTQ